ncbi:MAG: winged helix family transcriptional regulator [Winogradskyella sp.]|uniref:winged helix-turn-helix domain-containing protein n=1 Tax=Winogradskyella sp. TaxID=1883156 RepID=UPI000F4085BC|nr:winged helix-turn-helix domain-containing protein [Winogradskyella sp.]RNC88338.1 MAG: winged helix family transcriptional regulator [Winogradskyella sp.]
MIRNLFKYVMPLLFLFVLSCADEKEDSSTEHIKVVLREVGNQLLLVNKDSTSLILPVVAIEKSKFRLSFQKPLTFEPDDLVEIFRENFQKTTLTKDYRVEVIQCVDNEVAYSYEVSLNEENTIIPCISRVLPKACYNIEVRLINTKNSSSSNSILILLVALIGLCFLGIIFYYRRRNYDKENKTETAIKIGSFKFYADQNKLIKEAEEINLSKKECELLEIFVSRPNEVIKRDELTKRVWEDNGVFVGRSLDTYISKLRKKLKSDASIKLTNVHGVGYKLELK